MSKKVNYSAFTSMIAEANKAQEFHFGNGDNELIIEVRPHITYGKRMELIHDVAKLCFIKDEYHPEIFEFAFWSQVVGYYTNINCDVVVDRLWSVINDTGLSDRLWDFVKDDLYDLRKACMDYIDHRIKTEHMSWTDIAAKRLVNMIDSVDGLSEINKLYENNSGENITALFGGDQK